MISARRDNVPRLAAALWAAALAAGSLLPSGVGPLGGWDASLTPGLQNTLHVPAYGGLVVLLAWAMGRPAAGRLALAVLAAAAYGAALEAAQAWIPGRTGSLSDMMLNVAGAVLGAGATLLTARALKSRLVADRAERRGT